TRGRRQARFYAWRSPGNPFEGVKVLLSTVPEATSDRVVIAGRRAVGPEVVVHLVVAVGDELAAIGDTDTDAIACDGIVVEQHGGACAVGAETGPGIVHDRAVLDHDEGRSPPASSCDGEHAVGSVARDHAVADDGVNATHGEAAVRPQPTHVVLQVHPDENDTDGGEVAARLDRDPAARRAASVVEYDAVRDEQLRRAATAPHGDPTPPSTFEVPDHAVLNMNGGGLGDENAGVPGDLPVDDQAAQAGHGAAARVDEDADVSVSASRQDARLARPLVGDADRLRDRQFFGAGSAVVAGA